MDTKILKSYEVLTADNKSHYVSAYSKKSVEKFWWSSKIKQIIERNDIDSSSNINIEFAEKNNLSVTI